jgi:outer membrane protein assembly factor BamB
MTRPRLLARTSCAISVGLALVGVAGLTSAPPPRPGVVPPTSDYAMFGGTPARNLVHPLPVSLSHEFPVDPEDKKVHVLGHRVKWKADLGSRAYGGPVVAGGRVYAGTNNRCPRNPRDRGNPTEDEPLGPPLDKGILMCFGEATGRFLWQMVHDKLPGGLINDAPWEGVCATPTVENGRVYYVSNRCEVVCLDANGFADGNDGFQGEQYKTATDGDVIWLYDLRANLGVFPHNMSAGSPLIVGDRLFVVTANGVDEDHVKVAAPDAPSFVCLDKRTGKLLWSSNLPGPNIMHSQWSNPAYAAVDGKGRVIFPGGDGWLYAFEPDTGRLIWKFDASPKDGVYDLGGKGTKSDFIGMPVIDRGWLYVGTGQDPEHFDGVGHFWCIDVTREGDVSAEVLTAPALGPPAVKPNPNSAVVWHYGGADARPFARREWHFGRTMSTAAVVDTVVYITDIAGYLHCVDADTGRKYWQWDTRAAVWGSPYAVGGKVLVANEDGDLYFFKHEKAPVVLDEIREGARAGTVAAAVAFAAGGDGGDFLRAGLAARDAATAAVREKVKAKYLLQKVETGRVIRTTPIVANGVLYVMTEQELYAIQPK